MHATTTCARLGCNFAPPGPSSSQTVAIFRSTCTLAATLAFVLPAGCFIDGGGDDDDVGATTGETADETTSGTGSQITITTQSTVNPTTGVSATVTDTTSSTTQDTTAAESDPTMETGDTDTGSDTGSVTDTDPDTDSGTSSTTGDDTLSVADLEPGDLIITEVMANPNCMGDNCEWFELYNTTGFDIDLMNLGIGDRDDFENGTPGALISVSAILAAGEVGTLARQELWPYDESPEPLARYSNSVQLSNSTFEQVAVFSGNTVLDVSATFLPNEQSGRSRMLLADSWTGLDHTDSDDWCWSDTILPSTSTSDDWGTPASNLIECLPPA